MADEVQPELQQLQAVRNRTSSLVKGDAVTLWQVHMDTEARNYPDFFGAESPLRGLPFWVPGYNLWRKSTWGKRLRVEHIRQPLKVPECIELGASPGSTNPVVSQ